MNKRKLARANRKKTKRAVRKTKFHNQQWNKNVQVRTQPFNLHFQYHLRDIRGCGHFRAFKPQLALNNFDHPVVSTAAFATDRCILTDNSYDNVQMSVFQSVAGPDYFKVIKQLRRLLSPEQYIVYDTDDNLFCIPEWNFAHNSYDESMLSDIESIIRSVDILSCSTPYLADFYRKWNDKVVVNPNHLIKAMWGEPEFVNHNNPKPRILYAGSDNHFAVDNNDKRGDFDSEFIDFVMSTLDKYQWVFVGGTPAQLRGERNGKIEYHGWHSLLHFYPLLQNLKADIYLAPLADVEFNKYKSNLKCLEATALGVPIVCTDIEPYKDIPGAFKSTGEMIAEIDRLVSSSMYREAKWKEMHDILRPTLFWEENENTLKYINNFTRLAYGFEVPYGMGNKLRGSL